jgi:hypothetical protein
VRYRVFSYREAKLPGSGHHLGVHEETTRFRQELSQHFPLEHFQSAINISNLSPEQDLGKSVVTPREEPTTPGIFSIDPVARDDGVLVCEVCQTGEFTEIELAIGIGEGHKSELCSLKAGPEGSPITSVDPVPNELRMRCNRKHLLDNVRRVVAASIIYHQYFERIELLSESSFGFLHGLCDDRCLVVGWDHETDLVASVGRIHARPPFGSILGSGPYRGPKLP